MSASAVTVGILDGPCADCDAYVRNAAGAKLCHLPAWGEMVRRAAGHEPFYLVARDGRGVRGVLPVSHVRSRLFGNRMVSQPFATYGGPLFDDEETLGALFEKAVELARRRGCESLEIRTDRQLDLGLSRREDKISMRLRLRPDPDELWKSFKSDTKVRNHIRKARKNGVTAVNGGRELLDEFYDVYTVRMHQLGTPCYGRALFEEILRTFPDNSRIFLARCDGRTVGARLVLRFGTFLESVWGVTRIEYNRYSVNHFLYWAVFEHYCRRGAEWFDFGSSTRDSPHHKFKKQWGCQQVDLNIQYWLPEGRRLKVLSPASPKYRRKVAIWKKLPLRLTRLLGPVISRQLP
ncbi:MAG: FemAB family PEP-CTERM system-associated protein [Planctomycetes bacterium]|nr:FemAB family PEP-CTERM system-associated protein [Planctomycetota bacterium]